MLSELREGPISTEWAVLLAADALPGIFDYLNGIPFSLLILNDPV